MRKNILIFYFIVFASQIAMAQAIIPFDSVHWLVTDSAKFDNDFKSRNALTVYRGTAILKNELFENGIIEFDIFLSEKRGFPGVRFRVLDENNSESFYIRPHMSGKPDANQVTAVINRISGWQLYHGPEYSFIYDYNFSDWTHVKIMVSDDRAQIFLDYSAVPQLSWQLKHPTRSGGIALAAGPAHYSNFILKKQNPEFVDFEITNRELPKNLIKTWEVSSTFGEAQLSNTENLKQLIKSSDWVGKIHLEENGIANISRMALLNGVEENTVFVKVNINSERDQLKYFDFGYSDRAVVILNGEALYKGTNKFRTRDYRYLGTVGLFDGVFLNLKKGDNELILAVSEDFGGWGVTGRIEAMDGLLIR